MVEIFIQRYEEYLPSDSAFRDRMVLTLEKMIEIGEFDVENRPCGSNDSSVVFIGKTKAFQVFQFQEIATRIKGIISSILDASNIPLIKNCQINISDVIVWKRIIPLNSLNKELAMSIVSDHFDQFETDLNRALFSLHSIGYSHGDCRLDNIGFEGLDSNLKFYLFDFDASRPSNYSEKINDFVTLNESLYFWNIDIQVDKII